MFRRNEKSEDEIRRKKKKKHLRLQKTHPALMILVFLLITSLTSVCLALFVIFFFVHFVEAKIATEYHSVLEMTDVYEKALEDGNDPVEYLDLYGKDYAIAGSDLVINYRHGETTAYTEWQGEFDGIFETEPIHIISDNNNKLMLFTSDGRVMIHFPAAMNAIIHNDTNLPFWILTDLSDGNVIAVKCSVYVEPNDAALILTSVLFLTVISLLIMFSLLIFVIRSIWDTRKMMKMLFLDYVSDNHNWIWFKLKGEEMLRTNKAAIKEYAVVNLVMLGYQNYVLCHSVEEGEALLLDMFRTIENRIIKKKELAAHSVSSTFPLLLEFKDEQLLTARLKNLIGELEKIHSDQRFTFQAGVSVVKVNKAAGGIYLRRRDIDLEIYFNNAGAARMKLGGFDSGVAFFGESIREEQQWIEKIVNRRNHALEAEEFKVYYQPKYDPRTDELSGAEALIRWDSPEMGLIPPGRFIPAFEDDGFILKIDDYMLSHAARDQRRWLDQGYRCVPVSVNISRAHFADRDLADKIRYIVDREGAPHELIEIELTESAFFDDKDQMIKTILELKKNGFHVSMDDFGSGYSSLNSLKDMPLDVLKLDAGFFRDITDNDRSEVVVSEAIRLAKSLKMRTVAEGVEEKSQVDFLATEGCDMIQGYYYAKPMPADQFEKRMKTDEQ